jgi:hypothetical protein
MLPIRKKQVARWFRDDAGIQEKFLAIHYEEQSMCQAEVIIKNKVNQ